jgi:hypothetical protein
VGVPQRGSQGALRDPGLWNVTPSAYDDKEATDHGNGKCTLPIVNAILRVLCGSPVPTPTTGWNQR